MTAAEPIEWDGVLDLAYTLANAGEYTGAAAVLGASLSVLDPATTRPDENVIAAAVLFVRVVDPTMDLVPDEVAWARYAHQAAHTLHGPDGLTTIEATEALALALASHDRFAEAEQLRRDLIRLHLDRGDIDAHLLARMDLAQQWHDAGRCGDAIREATAAWQQWIMHHEPTDGHSFAIAMHLFWMLLACNRVDEAQAIAVAADLQAPEPGDATYDVLCALLASLVAGMQYHEPVCARLLDRTAGLRTARDTAVTRRLVRDQRGEAGEPWPR
ncbi:hypothetical protein [Dactylosporangium sp. NPDC048998]|uniref:hypothetical protein n=1 Tax=Dactylosporangium sp. NPDC048998 TaxID=3363976 RepID=UPI003723C64E